MKTTDTAHAQACDRPHPGTIAMNYSCAQLNPSAGQQPNFAASVALHLPQLTGLVRTIARSQEMVDDVVQQTVLKALVNAHHFRFESSVKTWLTSIAVNEIRQAYRCKWHKHSVSLTTEIIETVPHQDVDLPHLTYEATQRAVAVRNAVSRLPQIYRCVVELCDLQGLALTEAAQNLGLTLSAVKSRRHRARQKLLTLLATIEHAPAVKHQLTSRRMQ